MTMEQGRGGVMETKAGVAYYGRVAKTQVVGSITVKVSVRGLKRTSTVYIHRDDTPSVGDVCRVSFSKPEPTNER